MVKTYFTHSDRERDGSGAQSERRPTRRSNDVMPINLIAHTACLLRAVGGARARFLTGGPWNKFANISLLLPLPRGSQIAISLAGLSSDRAAAKCMFRCTRSGYFRACYSIFVCVARVDTDASMRTPCSAASD